MLAPIERKPVNLAPTEQKSVDLLKDCKLDMIYIVHYTPLVNRKAALIKSLAENKITQYEFYEGNCRDSLDGSKVQRYYLDDRDEANRRARFTSTNFNQKPLTPAEIGVTISHLEVWQLIRDRKQQRCLILEDDAVLCPSFATKLAEYMRRLPEEAEMCTLHDGCGLTPDYFGVRTNEKEIWYRMPTPFVRNCCSYIVTLASIEKIMPTIIPFCLGIDWEMQYHNIQAKIVMYWAHPPIIREGSSTGSFASSLR